MISLLFSAQVQTSSLQNVESGREAAEEHQLQSKPQEVPGARDGQQCGEGQQNV